MDRNLLTFLIVAETENITAAAARMNITQPTLTKRLQQLEASYSCKLVQRLPRGVKLTQHGKRLLPYAKRIEHEYLQAQEDIRSIKSGHLEELRVGAGPLFHLRYLGPAFERLRSEFPNTTISLTADVNSTNLPKLWEGKLDVVFGTTEHLEAGGQIVFQRLTTVEHGIVLPSDHPLAKSRSINVGQLGDIPWVVYSETSGNEEMVCAHFASLGLPAPNFMMRTTSIALGLQMVSEGNYVMTLPVQLKAILDARRLCVIRTDPPIGRLASGAYFRRSSQQYPIITRLIEIIAEAADD